MANKMCLKFWDVDHGACATLFAHDGVKGGKLAMIDCGSTKDRTPSLQIRDVWRRRQIYYSPITNTDQEQMSGLVNKEPS